jgi:hypothetical protein
MAPPPLPPDLERVGDEIVAAAARDLAARRHRRGLAARTAGTVIAAVLAGAVLLPAALGPSTRGPLLARTAPLGFVPAQPTACDQPGGRVTLPACLASDPVRIGRPRRW